MHKAAPQGNKKAKKDDFLAITAYSAILAYCMHKK
jgi:hypothetical protein